MRRVFAGNNLDEIQVIWDGILRPEVGIVQSKTLTSADLDTMSNQQGPIDTLRRPPQQQQQLRPDDEQLTSSLPRTSVTSHKNANNSSKHRGEMIWRNKLNLEEKRSARTLDAKSSSSRGPWYLLFIYCDDVSVMRRHHNMRSPFVQERAHSHTRTVCACPCVTVLFFLCFLLTPCWLPRVTPRTTAERVDYHCQSERNGTTEKSLYEPQTWCRVARGGFCCHMSTSCSNDVLSSIQTRKGSENLSRIV